MLNLVNKLICILSFAFQSVIELSNLFCSISHILHFAVRAINLNLW